MIGSTNVPGGLSLAQVMALIGNSEDNISELIAKMNNVQSVLIPASAWAVNDDGYYEQTVAISGYEGSDVNADDRPEIYFNKANVEHVNAEDYVEQCGYIMSIETGENCLICKAHEAPVLNITIDVKGV